MAVIEGNPHRRFGGKLAVLLLVVLLGVEISLRLAFSLPYFQQFLFVNEAVSWRRLWVARHDGDDSIAYSFDLYDPLLGWRNRPEVRNMSVFDGKFLNTNAHGLRGVRDYTYERIPGIGRIVVLGDSFTFGDEVSDDETYPYLLQQALPEMEVLNLGVHGYGHDQMLLQFQTEGVKYAPDIVLLGFNRIDMERNVLSFRDFAKPLFVLQDGELVLTHTPVPTPEEVLGTDWLRPRLVDGYAILTASMDLRSGARARAEEEITTAILSQLITDIETAGALPLFVYLPFAPEVLEEVDQTEGEVYFFSFCDAHPELRCFSTRPAFLDVLATGEDLVIDFHWDARGHQIIADAIYTYLVNELHVGAQ